VIDAIRSLLMTTGGRESRDSTRKDLLYRMRRYAEDPGSGGAYQYSNMQGEINAFAEEEANSLTFTLEALQSQRYGEAVEAGFTTAIRRNRVRALLTALGSMLVMGAINVTSGSRPGLGKIAAHILQHMTLPVLLSH